MNAKNILFDQEVFFTEEMNYFTDMKEINPIPAKSIIYKTQTGIGATHSEIVSDRDSIIVLPHISIVKSKNEKYRSEGINTFAVYGEVTKAQIFDYLKTLTGKAKILTTPMGLNKIVNLMKESKIDNQEIDYHKIFFLLLDESHKIIKDCDYRTDMVGLMEHFFAFNNQAMVSATPLEFTDVRFKQKKFRNIKITPTPHVKPKIELVHASSLINGLQTYFEENKSHHYFIFFNSVEGILDIIKKLKIKSDYRIYCSTKSVERLQLNHEPNTTTALDEFKNYNFLTSSFFNGLDIIVPYKPNIVILTDCSYRSHTMLDPYCDILQIIGRVRKHSKGDIPYNKITHINNARGFTESISQESALLKVEESKLAYKQIANLKAEACNKELYYYFDQALATVKPYSNLINENEDMVPILYDNYLYDERVKNYYKSDSALRSAYYTTQLYEVTNKREIYVKEELVNLSKQSLTYSKTMNELMANTLLSLEPYKQLEIYNEQREIIKWLSFNMFEAYERLGYAKMKELGFSRKKIRHAILKMDIAEGKNRLPAINLMHTFQLNRYYTVADIKIKLQEIFDEFGICYRAKATDLKYYFELKEVKRLGNKSYVLTSQKQFAVKKTNHV